MLVHRKAYEEAAAMVHAACVLDWGCNDGYGLEILRSAGHSVTGVDVAPDALAAANERFGGQVRLALLDRGGAPFPDASFDLVTSFQCIEHVVDYAGYCGEIRRLLKPGGRALFTTPNADIRLDPGAKPWSRFHIHEFSGAELAHLLRQHFASVEVQGLFACPELTSIELRRCGRARFQSRSPIHNFLGNTVWAKDRIVRRRLPDCTTAHLHYATSRIDAALDLMALCRA